MACMARRHGIALLALIAAGTATWVVLARNDPQEPPVALPPGPEDAPERPAGDPPEPAAGRREPARPGGTGVEGARGAAPAPQPEAAAAGEPAGPGAAATPGVLLRVRERGGRPVAAFTWRFQPEGGEPVTGAGEDGSARLALPAGSTGRLLVEAPGFEPGVQPLAVPEVAAEPLGVDVFLAATPPLAGVAITAVDRLGEPVGRLRIDLWRLPEGAPAPAADIDPAGRTLWSRTGEAADGSYRLPPLAAGRYALRAQPCREDGTALPLLPERRVFAFAGHEAVPLRLSFAPGVVLAITSAEPGSASAGQGPARELQVTVRGGDGAVLPMAWRSRTAEGFVVADGAVTLPGEAATLLAQPPGHYAVAVQGGAGPVPVLPLASEGGVRTFLARLPQ